MKHPAARWIVVIMVMVGASGCAPYRGAFVSYSPTTKTYDLIADRPMVAVAPFTDARSDKFTVGSVGYYELKTSVDVGQALQAEVVDALHMVGYNAVPLEHVPDAAAADTLLNRRTANMILSGELTAFSAKTVNAMFAAAVEGRAKITWIARADPASHQRDIHVTGRQGINLIGLSRWGDNAALNTGATHRHPEFDALFRQSLARLAMGIVEDTEVRGTLERLKRQ